MASDKGKTGSKSSASQAAKAAAKRSRTSGTAASRAAKSAAKGSRTSGTAASRAAKSAVRRSKERAAPSGKKVGKGEKQTTQHRIQISRENKKSKEGTHGYPYQVARKKFMVRSMADHKTGKDIKGWIKQEANRVGKSGYWRSPPGYDVGHKKPGIDRPSNFQWELSSMNQRKGGKYKR
jgi:hypothetical protein